MASLLDRSEFERWRAQAQSAAETAVLARRGGRHEWACVLSEQAAQLVVKGLLHGLGPEAWGRDLTVLCSHTRDAIGTNWPATATDAAARLSRHYIPTRYPDAHASGAPSSHYTDADSAQAAEDVRTIEAAVECARSELGGQS
jgi:HEPN domain-containing protein